MIRVNLLPPDLQKRRKVQFIDSTFIYVVLAIVAELLFLYSYNMQQKMQISSLKEEITITEGEIKKYEPILKSVDEAILLREKIKQRTMAIQALELLRPLWVRVFEEFALVIPENLWFSSIKYAESDGKILMNGSSYSLKDIAKLLINLINSKYFNGINLSTIQKGLEVNNTNTYTFNLSMNLVRASAEASGTGEFKMAGKKSQAQKTGESVKKIDLQAKGREALGLDKDNAKKSMEGLAPKK
jgi:Tfp pilus assembly protein PilN